MFTRPPMFQEGGGYGGVRGEGWRTKRGGVGE